MGLKNNASRYPLPEKAGTLNPRSHALRGNAYGSGRMWRNLSLPESVGFQAGYSLVASTVCIPTQSMGTRLSRLLAEGLKADAYLILTDVPAVATNFGHPDSKNIRCATPEAMDKLDFASGSMGPKVESVVEFVRNGGKMAAIGSLDQAAEILTSDSGTVIRQDVAGGISYYD